MIIACPECTSPFQVVDGQIAALVQVECPTCSFRMILDFEAANDASLREAGMKMAQGFQSEVAYRQAVGQQAGADFGQHTADFGQHTAARPELRAVPEPVAKPEPAVAPPVRSTPPPTAPPVAQPPVQPAAVQTPEPASAQPAAADKPPVRARPRPRPTLIAQTAPPPVRQPTDFTAPAQAEPTQQPTHAEAHIATHVGPPPTADDAQLEASDDGSGFSDGAPEPMDMDMDMDVEEVAPEHPHAELRTPPHTPSPPTATADPSTALTPADATPTLELEAKDNPKKSVFGSVLKIFFLVLLLLVGGLMVWSVIVYQTSDPRQLLQDQLGIDLGVPMPAADEPAAAVTDQAGDAKADDAKAPKAGASKSDNG